MIDNQRVTWTAFAILAMFNIQDSERESENLRLLLCVKDSSHHSDYNYHNGSIASISSHLVVVGCNNLYDGNGQR